MKIKKLSDNVRPSETNTVRMKITGNIVELRYMAQSPHSPIEKLDRDTYVLLSTGEVLAFDHTDSRANNISNVAQSMKRLRDSINTNTTEPQNCLWVTLTYRENMRDSVRLYTDVKKFHMRFRGYLTGLGLPPYEYIACAEPQQRGAWHLHLILIFPAKAPYISNTEMARIWGQGFTKTKALDFADNYGFFLAG